MAQKENKPYTIITTNQDWVQVHKQNCSDTKKGNFLTRWEEIVPNGLTAEDFAKYICNQMGSFLQEDSDCWRHVRFMPCSGVC